MNQKDKNKTEHTKNKNYKNKNLGTAVWQLFLFNKRILIITKK